MDKQAIIKALRDTAQSASNAAAGNVSAPIDAIAWALRKAGVNMPNPVGGSEWMQSKGLTAPVDEGVPKMAGDVIGNLIPAIGLAKAPQIAAGMNRMVDNAMAPATLGKERGAIVWHGSPHKFDKFDSSKIGTGEGAQAYGHGLYLAESPEVAAQYRKQLSPSVAINSKNVDSSLIHGANSFKESGASFEDALAGIKSAYKSANAKDIEAAAMKAYGQDYGSLYKVDLPDDHIAKMLDWDKPLSQQAPEVQAIFGTSNKITGAQALKAIEANPDQYFSKVMSGKELTGAMIRPERGASEYLKKQGIPGIRYLDGGSRTGGAGTSNFVVFPGNEDILKIIERNGQSPGLMGIK